jgi:hypothetical protein
MAPGHFHFFYERRDHHPGIGIIISSMPRLVFGDCRHHELVMPFVSDSGKPDEEHGLLVTPTLELFLFSTPWERVGVPLVVALAVVCSVALIAGRWKLRES